ncbi:hypothetical protein ACJJTC_006742 [Scirpophaga incertulas]
MLASVLVYYTFLGAALCDSTAKLRFFSRSTDDFLELSLETAHDVFKSSWYNSSRNTVIFAHGFTGYPEGPAVSAVINSYLDRGDSNVVLLNWKEMAASIYPNIANSYLRWAAPNARKLGAIFAETLSNMSAAGFDLNKTHLVGHSLGAHIFGIAGNTLLQRGVILPWITGLDPAGVGFESRPPAGRLNANSADFVSVIHTDPSKYGFKRQLGTVDFWPNYRINRPVLQPGCDNRTFAAFSKEDLCSHNRCWELLIDAMKHPGTIIGSYAKNYRKWKNNSQQDREVIVLELGVHDIKAVPGDYFLMTSARSPYGLGREGL